jgi:hypothetical protein
VTLHQANLFELAPVAAAPATVASPLCMYEHCSRKGRAALGPPDDRGGCVNRSITYLTCGATGVQSARKDLA